MWIRYIDNKNLNRKSKTIIPKINALGEDKVKFGEVIPLLSNSLIKVVELTKSQLVMSLVEST